MKLTNLGTPKKCMNPEKDCPNKLDPQTAHVVIFHHQPLVLCQDCGPAFKLQTAMNQKESN